MRRLGSPVRLAIGFGYAVCLGAWTSWAMNDLRGALVAVPAVLLIFFSRKNANASVLLRTMAWVHAAAALLMIRIYYGKNGSLSAYLLYIFQNVTMPGFVIAYLTPDPPESTQDALPRGYDYFDKAGRGLGPFEKLVLVIVMSMVIAALMAGWMFLAAILLPAGFAGYYILKILFSRRTRLPETARRIKLSPRMQKPGQTHGLYTWNDSEFKDPDLYE